MKAKKWILAQRFHGHPNDSNIELVEEELRQLNDGEILCEAMYLSVDPYMRAYASNAKLGSTVMGEQLARVIETKNDEFSLGQLVLGQFGWRSHTVAVPGSTAEGRPNVPLMKKMPDVGDLPPSLALGMLGMPGVTAFFGFTKLCQGKPGDVVLVNAAAGCVGSVVGQIAKIQGCRVVGCAGTEAKCSWLRELGFDYVFNYKTTDLGAALKEAAPDGFDCYYDNVGGEFTATVLSNHMKLFGRVAVCGCMADYNDTAENPSSGPYPWKFILLKQLTVTGFICRRWAEEWDSALNQLIDWVHQDKIKYREHVTEGFENMRHAFYGMLKGENTGKAVVKV